MDFDFNTFAARLRSISVDITEEEQVLLNNAIPFLMHEHSLHQLVFWGRIKTVSGGSYIILIGYKNITGVTASKSVFLASQNYIGWDVLPEANEKVVDVLNKLGYGIESQRPFTGKINELYYSQPEDDEEEDQDNDEDEKEQDVYDEEENNDGEEGVVKQNKQKKERPPKVTEAHRLTNTILHIHYHMRIYVPSAFYKRNGTYARNPSFRGINQATAKDLTTRDEFMKYLQGDTHTQTFKNLSDPPLNFSYNVQFNLQANATVVTSRIWPGGIFYILSNCDIWGSVYSGYGLQNMNAIFE